MRIVQQNSEQTLNISIPMDFKPDLGREDSLKEFETETLRDIINPIENYETSRFIHKPYSGQSENPNDLQCDIWYHFYFYSSNSTHLGGLDYSLVGISENENAKMLKQSTESFFRLEFFKIPDGEKPERMNRRLVFAKNLTIPLGERVFLKTAGVNYELFNDYVYVPVFVGSNFKNKENMYLFWFQDDTALTETILTGDTFYMTARFFNADDGSILNFSNESKSKTDNINENADIYYQVIIDRSDYSYQVFQYDGETGNRVGQSGNPIKFYEIAGGG